MLHDSLHDITKSASDEGLEARFGLEIDQLDLDKAEREGIAGALRLALRVHDGDMRGDEPYSTHLLRNTIRIICHFDYVDKNTIIASLLHDSVEDHPKEVTEAIIHQQLPADIEFSEAELQETALALLAKQFDPEVAEIVQGVTNPEFHGATKEDRQEEYRQHVRMALCAENPKIAIVKISDLTDNLAGQRHNDDQEDRVRRIYKYYDLIPDVVAATNREDMPLSDEVKQFLTEKFTKLATWCNKQKDGTQGEEPA